nr:hypothetical protein [Tanacetum cinerariifolium]
LKTFGGNKATKKTKKNLLKQQYGNFRAKGLKTLEKTFSRLQVIVGQLQFMDVEVEQDDLNQKFLTSLAPEWLMHTIVWRNMSDLDTMSLDDLYNNLKVYESEVQKKLEPNSQNMAFISSPKHSSGKEDGYTACVPTASTNVPTASASVATISQDTACAYIASQSSDIEKDDLNQKFLTSLAPEWLIHTIVWRNRNDLDSMSLDDLYNHLKVYEAEVQKKPNSNPQDIAFISSSKNSNNEDGNTMCVTTATTPFPTGSGNVAIISQDTANAFITSQSNGSQIKFEDINQIDMGHFARECRAPRNQEGVRKEIYGQRSKAKEKSSKALMAIDGVGWDWSYMANEEDHALVADGE